MSMEEMSFSHEPVLLAECIEGLAIRPDGVYFDGTAGGGGHSLEIAKRLTTGRLFSTDKDPDAVRAAGERLAAFANAEVIEGDYKDARALLAGKTDHIDGALLDLGVSSYQLDSAERGFSYAKEGILDMRMSHDGTSAKDLVNTLSWQELADILRMYGEEPYAAPIARKIAAAREQGEIVTTTQLSDIVTSALPPSVRRKEKHPARRTFQALRIAVNDELDTLRAGLADIFGLLSPGGRFCVLTFHSLEDRIVKQYFASLEVACTCPKDFPVCVCGGKAKAKAITKKPVVAGEAECAENHRARSAKLRIIEKLPQ
ncbi:MAG: 16S rRNA (cytosine(1402)-N(4))-methyltransferase RsmH [Oscillospiraceae bacterium]|nr:16S rRNA (cytosine(1402)-N(4))-methyltransferase RsmH [Oscillospiraceae bacterium]